MTLFIHTYDDNLIIEISVERYNELLNDFDCEVTCEDIETRIEYAKSNDSEVLLDFFKTINTKRTIVMHFDSEFDVYIAL